VKSTRRDRGELAIVLHSHMPYVEGFGTWPFGEEWLLEAIAATYLPLISNLERWAETGEKGVATIGITPVLADQLVLDEVGERFLRFMRSTRVDCHRLDIEGFEKIGEKGLADALRSSARDYEAAAEQFEQLGNDLVGAFRRFEAAGIVELWSSAATHAVLPLLATEAGVSLQLQTGVDSHRERFGSWSGGFWLPECAYSDGIEAQLSAAGVHAFCVDQTVGGDPLDQLEPIAAEGDVVAIPIDWRTISLVWDDDGYPADPVYRDYHAHTTNGLRPYANAGRPYDRDAGAERARAHAADFVGRVLQRLDTYRAERRRPGLVVCALDTELLGHWWYEGPVWLAAVVAEARSAGLALATLPSALERHEPVRKQLRESTWGKGKDLGTWDSPAAAGLVWSARRAELALMGKLGGGSGSPGTRPVSPERAARELLALQSSDWAFMATRELAADYPQQRVAGHVEAFEQALSPLGVTDSRPMSSSLTPELRGLAPGMRLSGALAPASGWGRPDLGRSERA
jgi:1,4-alpha-glucan branching enzyme